ncbi:MAG: hypothetical protein KGM16_02350 [Bacteroidota bacterium]|nr:hypothetical protein [Bacteroidota bacterium]
MKTPLFFLLFFAAIINCSIGKAQPITGVWKGKIDHRNVELKIVKNGDSLTGTSYYYISANNFRRYSIKGYFDATDNSVTWWDDQLIEEKNANPLLPKKAASPYMANADFNCPGGTKMYLTGKAALKEKPDQQYADVDLQKFMTSFFSDEWDYVIDNYTLGANDPHLIDSIGKLAFNRPVHARVTENPQLKRYGDEVVVQPKKKVVIPVPARKPAIQTTSEPAPEPMVKAPLTNEQKLMTRTRHLVQEIPVTGDSLELRFYDNAEIDGDSIAVFLNDKMLAEHIRLSDTAFIIRLPVAGLQPTNDLVMVAENLGSIPPNTSLMIAMVDGRRYEARLASTENSSALIRLVRKEKPTAQSVNSQ